MQCTSIRLENSITRTDRFRFFSKLLFHLQNSQNLIKRRLRMTGEGGEGNLPSFPDLLGSVSLFPMHVRSIRIFFSLNAVKYSYNMNVQHSRDIRIFLVSICHETHFHSRRLLGVKTHDCPENSISRTSSCVGTTYNIVIRRTPVRTLQCRGTDTRLTYKNIKKTI